MPVVDTRTNYANRLEMLWLELTTSCNLACQHCYADAGPTASLEGRMSLRDWYATIDEALELGATQFQLIGGEPTLHPHFRELLAHVGKARPRTLEVFTNATRLTDDIIGCLKDNRAAVAASFYAEDPAVHDAVTQRSGSWQRTVTGIERALAAGLDVRIGVIETAENRAQVHLAVAFLQRLGIRDIGIDGERGIGRGSREAKSASGEDYTQLCGQCGKGRLCATAAGVIYPCVFSRKTPLGTVRTGGLHAALANPALTGFCASLERALRSTQGFCPPGPQKPCVPDQPQPDINPCNPWLSQRGQPLRHGESRA